MWILLPLWGLNSFCSLMAKYYLLSIDSKKYLDTMLKTSNSPVPDILSISQITVDDFMLNASTTLLRDFLFSSDEIILRFFFQLCRSVWKNNLIFGYYLFIINFYHCSKKFLFQISLCSSYKENLLIVALVEELQNIQHLSLRISE